MAARRKAGIEQLKGYLRKGKPGVHTYVSLLGLDILEGRDIMHVAERGIPYGTFESLRDNTDFSVEDTMRLTGIPRRTLTRRKREGRFPPDESDRLLRAARVFGRAVELFGGDSDAAAAWLSVAQPALGGRVPLDLAASDVGAREVERVIGRLEHGVFS